MKPPKPVPGKFVRRHHVDECLVVVAVDQNIVLRNKWGYFHTISFDVWDNCYVPLSNEDAERYREANR